MPTQRPRFCSLGAISISLCVALAVIAAALLRAAPALHEHLHHDAVGGHLCAVSFFTSGHCEAASPAAPSVVPAETLLLGILVFSHAPALPKRRFFARHEHGPPALA